MTVEAPAAREVPTALPFWRRALAFGTGFGIAIGERNLEAAIVQSRPSGVTTIATTTIHDFRNRPAAEWGAELLRFLAATGETRLAATVLLPRDEVIVREVAMHHLHLAGGEFARVGPHPPRRRFDRQLHAAVVEQVERTESRLREFLRPRVMAQAIDGDRNFMAKRALL